ncbi:MAG: hypothetical protein RLZZ455_472 [Candidatus Parcubacteria bacterium]|jgi:hypothetical protein
MLPVIAKILVFAVFIQLVFLQLPHIANVSAQVATPIPSVTFTPTPTVPSSLQQNVASPGDLPGDWIIDPEVTNIGKNAARAGIFLDWAIQNYDWAYVDVGGGKSNPLIPFWITLRNIVYAFLILVVIVGAFTLIVTRGKSVTLRRFIPRFLMIVILVTFSFAFVEFLYQIVDVFQGFFIRPGGIAISQKDLLYIGWKYNEFVGLRALGSENFESAFISLLLVKLTSFTYYAMVGILLIRKIILWFFIMISPFFPLLLIFYPLRNTAKIWLGEFFRWLLYAPLFAIFLAGLVSLWKVGIPLSFNFINADKGLIVFPTAVSILLGGPLQKVGVANSVNLADTFGLYIVALLMLWMVIIFPFILLQIFLDYLSNININQNALARQLMNVVTRPPSPSGGTPPAPTVTGLARALPFIRDFAIPKPASTGLAREIPRVTKIEQPASVLRSVSQKERESVERLTALSIPTIRDIARFESDRVQKDRTEQKEVEKMREILRSIANPQSASSTTERERFSEIKEKLVEQSKNGNQAAGSMLRAAETLSAQVSATSQSTTALVNLLAHLIQPESLASTKEKEKYVELREKLVHEKEKNNSFATTMVSSMTNTKETLRTVAQAIANPEHVSEQVKNTLTDLKETLQKESAVGNQLATSVLSVFEKLERVERISVELRGVLNPGTVTERKEKEHVERIKETLIKEKENNNTLASSVLSHIEKLSHVLTTDEKSQVIQSLKDEVIKEHEKNNSLAEYLMRELPELMQVEGDLPLSKVQGDLEKAKNEGNPLATKLLAIASETSRVTQQAELESLQSEITEAKAKGDPLAIALSDILYPKPKLASKPDAFPTTNRIQEVSLDDYEAVKKMWTENYQNLETTESLGDQVAKKDWIQDDIAQISDTIALLSSENAEKVEEGMQKVSDILPFLLVGGFSQSEIVAYLKAKQAAAKDVLSDIEKQSNDEDTKIIVEHHQEVHPQTMTTSAETVEEMAPVSIQSESVMPIHQEHLVPLVAQPKFSIPEMSSTQMLRLANVSIPSIRTIAAYDEALLSHNTPRVQEIQKIQQSLRDIADPKGVSDQASRTRFVDIHDALQKESEQGNTVATSLISAGKLMGRLTAQGVFSEVLQLSMLLQNLSDPSSLKNKGESPESAKLLEAIRMQQQAGSALATEMMRCITQKDTQNLVALWTLCTDLKTAEESGDQLAVGVLSQAAKIERSNFAEQFSEMVGLYLLVDALSSKRSLFTDESGEMATLLSEIRKRAENGNDLAKSLLEIRDATDVSSLLTKIMVIDQSTDQFATQLRVSLIKLGSVSPLVQSSQQRIKQSLTKILSFLANPLGGGTREMTKLHEQLVAAKKDGNVVAERVLAKADEHTREEIRIVGKILKNIALPDAIADAGEKASFTDLRARLEKEKAKNNELADEILTVANVLNTESATSLDKSTISVMLWEQLVEARNEGDQIAESILSAVTLLQRRDLLHSMLSDMLASLSQPELLTNPLMREQYSILREKISVESKKENALALLIVPFLAVKNSADPSVVSQIGIVLNDEAQKGNQLASEFMKILRQEEQNQSLFAVLRVMRGLSDPESIKTQEQKEEFVQLRKQLEKAAQADNTTAMSLLSASERAKAEGDDFTEAKKFSELLAHDHSETSASVHAFIDRETEREEDVLVLRSILHGLEHPEYLPDLTVRHIFETLKKDLSVEAQHGNPVAKMIEKTTALFGKEGGSVDKELLEVSSLYEALNLAKGEGDARAQEMIALINAQHVRMQAGRLAGVMEYIADPGHAPVGHEQDSYKAIKESLILERNKGNTFAAFLLSLAQSFAAERIKEDDMQSIIALLHQKLSVGAAEGNSFAMNILSRLQPKERDGSLPEIETLLLTAKEKGDPVAEAVFAVIDTEHQKNRVSDGIVLPSVNRIQEVSLDDYEAVRAMWEESYKTLDVPEGIQGYRPSREEWLRNDIARIEKAVSLLMTVDQQKINEGMQQVVGILPFLLIGGFSLAEIIAYLKAKLQAAKTVLSNEKQSAEGEIPLGKTEPVQKMVKAEEKDTSHLE